MDNFNLGSFMKIRLTSMSDQIYASEHRSNNCTKCKTKKYTRCQENCNVKCSIEPEAVVQYKQDDNQLYKEQLDENGRSELHLLACQGDVDKVFDILKKGADPCRKTLGGSSPLYFAVYSGCPHMVELLIKWGCNVNEMAVENDTPLIFLAITQKKPIVVQQMLHCGADVNLIDNGMHNTPLHWACEKGSNEMVRLLLAHNARACKVNSKGWTPLFIAIYRKKIKTSHLLIKYEVNCDQYLKFWRNKELLRNESIEYGGNFDEYAEICMNKQLLRNKSIELCRNRALHLSKLHVNVNVCNNIKETPLHIAILMCDYDRFLDRNGHYECSDVHCPKNIIVELLKRGARVNAQSNWGTPLHVAMSRYSCKNSIQVLLDYGADVNIKNRQGFTPIQMLTYNTLVKEIIEQLLVYGTSFQNQSQRFLSESLKVTWMRVVFRFYISRQMADFPKDPWINFLSASFLQKLEKARVNQFTKFCLREVYMMKSEKLVGNVTFFEFLHANKEKLVHLLSRHRASVILKMMPIIKHKFPIYYLMLRRNWSIGWRFAPVFNKAVTLLDNALGHRLPVKPLKKIVLFLNYDETKMLIKTINEVKSLKKK